MNQEVEDSRLWSLIWQHFQKVYKEISGEKVRFAKCNICNNELCARSTSAKGHLRRHIKRYRETSGLPPIETV